MKRKARAQPQPIGPTGRPPLGPRLTQDESELSIAVGVNSGKVVMQFGTPVSWIAMMPDQAMEIGSLLITHAEAARNRKPT